MKKQKYRDKWKCGDEGEISSNWEGRKSAKSAKWKKKDDVGKFGSEERRKKSETEKRQKRQKRQVGFWKNVGGYADKKWKRQILTWRFLKIGRNKENS